MITTTFIFISAIIFFILLHIPLFVLISVLFELKDKNEEDDFLNIIIVYFVVGLTCASIIPIYFELNGIFSRIFIYLGLTVFFLSIFTYLSDDDVELGFGISSLSIAVTIEVLILTLPNELTNIEFFNYFIFLYKILFIILIIIAMISFVIKLKKKEVIDSYKIETLKRITAWIGTIISSIEALIAFFKVLYKVIQVLF